MQEVVIHTWCDRHAITGENVAGAAFALSLPGHPNRELDLCPDCRTELVDELLELVAKHSRPADTPIAEAVRKVNRSSTAPKPSTVAATPEQLALDGKDAAPVECPICTMGSASYAGANQHARVYHGVTLPRLVGDRCPVCGLAKAALGQHAVKVHGAADVLELLAQAEQLGDEFGVAAAIRSRFAAAAKPEAAA